MAVKLHEIYWLIVQPHICGNPSMQNLVQGCPIPIAASAYVAQPVYKTFF